MKLSTYILQLQHLLELHGDLEVETTFSGGERKIAPEPEIAYKQIMVGRCFKPIFWSKYYPVPSSAPAGTTREDLKGEKVVKV